MLIARRECDRRHLAGVEAQWSLFRAAAPLARAGLRSALSPLRLRRSLGMETNSSGGTALPLQTFDWG
jgi:hypothetical protein